MATTDRARVSVFGIIVLMLMRVAIGWHFLYEGLVKLLDGKWTAAAYLKSSTGPLADWFGRIAGDPMAMRIVDQLNIWGLILVGGCLMLGLVTRFAAFCGIGMLAMYYLAYPPLAQSPAGGLAEGHYLLVSKTLVELLALAVVLALPASVLGLDGVIFGPRARKTDSAADDVAGMPPVSTSRRHLIGSLAGVPFAGAFAVAMVKRKGWISHEEKNLQEKADAMSGATIKTFDFSATVKDLKGTLPTGKIGNVTLSRMILGGNLVGGWAHARDLIYVSTLVKAYHTREKIFQTFQLAEACGVNTFLTNPVLCNIISDYWKSTNGKMQFISDLGWGNVVEMVQKSVDNGACACYVQGGAADLLVEKGDFDTIARALDLCRKNKVPAGIGGHKLATITACVEKGLIPDFWMKTLHKTNYWSAQAKQENDNIWCTQPEETIAFMNSRPEPWIAFKVLAAGAIHPKDAFRFAFASGADFICVGMYDFQIVEDVNLAIEALGGKLERQRKWYA